MLLRLRGWLRTLLRYDTVEREMREEMQVHLDRAAERLTQRGLSAAEARAAAAREFGNVAVIQEQARDARGVRWIVDAAQDVRYAFRGVRSKPGFTVAVALTMGLGVGVNATMFGIVDRLLFRPPPMMRDATRVHRLYLSYAYHGDDVREQSVEFARYVRIRDQAKSFDAFASFLTRPLLVGTDEGSQERNVTIASASVFAFFDAPPALGRYYTEDDDHAPEGSQVAVISYPFWQAAYGGRRDVLGTRLQIDRMEATIIGVTPKGFSGIDVEAMPVAYVPITAYAFSLRGPAYLNEYGWTWLRMIARRRAGVSVDRATAELTAAYEQSWRGAGDEGSLDTARPRVIAGPVQLARGPLASKDAKVATLTSVVALLVLLIACANVANLQLSRVIARRRELSLRRALGSSRGRLVRQLLAESLVLAALGGATGLLFAQWGSGTLRALSLITEAHANILTDGRTLLFALAATLAAAVLSGTAPCVHAGRADLGNALNAGGRDVQGRSGRARSLLLLFQAILCVVLLVGAGLFVRSLERVSAMRLGYDVDPVLVVRVNLRGTKLTRDDLLALDDRLLAETRGIPGISHATTAVSVPLSYDEGRALFVDGVDSVEKLGHFVLQAGTPDYFATVGTRVLRGRAFDERDRLTSPPVVVVSQGMARTLWPGQEPLGKCIRIRLKTSPCTTVIGVAEDIRARSLSDAREHTYYLPAAQVGPSGSFLVRTAGDASAYAATVRARLQQIVPGASYVTVVPLRTLVDPTFRNWRLGATMFGAFGALALALAALGLYAVVAHNVAQRRQEIGVRIALGASRAAVVRLFVGRGMRLVLAGVAIGSVLALLGARLVEPLLFRESPSDPIVFGLVALVLISVGLVAAVVPSVAASAVDPNIALRAD